MQTFLVKRQYLRPLKQYGDQAIPEQLKRHARKRALEILTTFIETRLNNRTTESGTAQNLWVIPGWCNLKIEVTKKSMPDV